VTEVRCESHWPIPRQNGVRVETSAAPLGITSKSGWAMTSLGPRPPNFGVPNAGVHRAGPIGLTSEAVAGRELLPEARAVEYVRARAPHALHGWVDADLRRTMSRPPYRVACSLGYGVDRPTTRSRNRPRLP
jgi:hypothetical protein